MLKSNWLAVVIGGAMAIALWLLAIEFGYQLSYPTSTNCFVVQRSIIGESASITTTDAAEAISRYRDCLDREDLIAQQSTAHWAFWSLLATLGGVVVGGIGLFFVWRTLRDTNVANQSEFRAYVRLKVDSQSIAAGAPIKLGVESLNYGRTPARRCTIAGVIVVREKGWWWEVEDDLDRDPSGAVLHPNDPLNSAFASSFSLTEAVLSKIKSG